MGVTLGPRAGDAATAARRVLCRAARRSARPGPPRSTCAGRSTGWSGARPQRPPAARTSPTHSRAEAHGDLGRGPRDVRRGSARHGAALIPTAMRWCSPTATPVRSRPAGSARHSRRCTRCTQAGRRVAVDCRRDPAAAAGQPADRVGADAGRRAVHRHRRRHGGEPAPPGRRHLRHRRRRPDRGQRRRRQQDRHLRRSRSRRGRTACRSTWPRPARPSIRPRPTARRSRSRSGRAEEVARLGGRRSAPDGRRRCGIPAFDVTPAALVTAIITDRGVFAPADVGGTLSS